MRNDLLTKARKLDKVMREGNLKAIKNGRTGDQKVIEKGIYENLYNIRDCIIEMILIFDENDAKRKGYFTEYNSFINKWNKFTNENVSPEVAGIRLEDVRKANISLIDILDNDNLRFLH